MWCLTKPEAELWCEGRGLGLDSRRQPDASKWSFKVRKPLAGLNWSRLTGVSSFVASFTQPDKKSLLWITQTGVWSSSENWSLFYRLRQSYGELRSIEDAPAHEFLRHESADLTNFVEIALICGWDFYLMDWGSSVFVSHDEFVEFWMNDSEAQRRAEEF
jgi:hypothetical protein